MVSSPDSARKALFNNPLLSDVKIRQHYKGKVKEYFAHKAVLCAHSQYFMNTFSGSFKEATEGVMNIHDDNPEFFEIMLQFFYTINYDCPMSTRKTLTDAGFERCILVPIQLCTLADKYDLWPLQAWAANTFASHIKAMSLAEAQWERIVQLYYGKCATAGTFMGKEIASSMVSKSNSFIKAGVAFPGLALAYPAFGTDILLQLRSEVQLKGVKA